MAMHLKIVISPFVQGKAKAGKLPTGKTPPTTTTSSNNDNNNYH